MLFSNEYDVEGITVGLNESPDKCTSDASFGLDHLYEPYAVRPSWEADRAKLEGTIGGFPSVGDVNWYSTDFCPHDFDSASVYGKNDYASVSALIDAIEAGPIHLLLWGGAQEAAVAVKYLSENNPSVLSNLYVIGHQTGSGYNYGISPAGHDYLVDRAQDGAIRYTWVANMFESQLMTDANCSVADGAIERTNAGSDLSEHMLTNGTWFHGGQWRDMPDASDFITGLLLLGYAGGLCDVPDDGSKYKPGTMVNGVRFRDATCQDKAAIADVVSRRLQAAAGSNVDGAIDRVPGLCGAGQEDGDWIDDSDDGDADPGSPDSDGDGTPDVQDGCINDSNKVAPGDCGCGVSDVDSDGDIVPDCNDPCPTDPDDNCLSNGNRYEAEDADIFDGGKEATGGTGLVRKLGSDAHGIVWTDLPAASSIAIHYRSIGGRRCELAAQ